MGSDAGYDNEQPAHPVALSRAFYMSRYEVTQRQWEAVMGTRPWQGTPYVREGGEYPAVYVSWEDVQRFVERLNAQDTTHISGGEGSFFIRDPAVPRHLGIGPGLPESVELGDVQASVGPEFHRDGSRQRKLVEQLDVDEPAGRDPGV